MDVSTSDIEMRAARLADPGVDLKLKHSVACELREMVDTVHEGARVFSHLVPALIDMLRSGEPAFRKDTLEYQFRRALLDIIHRCPPQAHTQTLSIYSGLLHILRHDNEENGVICCKTIIDLVRTHRAFPEEAMSEFMTIVRMLLQNMPGLVQDLLSENSTPIDTNTLLPSIRSFKVAAEVGLVLVTFSSSPQISRQLVAPAIQSSLSLHFDVLATQAPQQQKAREEYEAMGGIWAGMAPTIVNSQAYADFIQVQIKVLSYIAYALRSAPDVYETYGNTMVLTALRLLQDCPDSHVAIRKDITMVCRHLFTTPYRKILLPNIEKVLEDRVLFGRSVACKETLKSLLYATMADLVHQVRADLTAEQATKAAFLYARLLQDTTLSASLHILFCKMLFNLAEPIFAHDTQPNAIRTVSFMFEVLANRLEALTFLGTQVGERIERIKKGDKQSSPIAQIEEGRTICRASWAVQKPEDFFTESRTLFRALLHGFRVFLQNLKKYDAQFPDGTLVFRIFEAGIHAMSFFDGYQETRDFSEALESFSGFLAEVNQHIFQEVWTHKIDFFIEQARRRPALCQICVFLTSKEHLSPALTSIVLRYLVDRLPALGNEPKDAAVVTIRMYKLAFNAVSQFPSLNEPILATHLGKLIMDCFPLAAKSSTPTNYFMLLRSLFRAIAQGGGKFEQLYKEVLPLLPDMLECLNRHLHASEGEARDMIVELCLTVPLRLTHLLPHLTYLMQPLAMALRGPSGSELVTQGLRTLELCIDNLTPDFLDPTLNTVLRELMEALHMHLKPLPAHHVQSHTTIRILGKLGGRNRKLMYQPPALSYHEHHGSATIPIVFGGVRKELDIAPMSLLASKEVAKPSAPSYRESSYVYAKSCLAYLLDEDICDKDCQDVFLKSLQSLFDAISWPERAEEASDLLRKLSQQIFSAEMRRVQNGLSTARRYPSWVLACYLDAMTHALAREDAEQARKAHDLVTTIVRDLIASRDNGEFAPTDVVFILNQIASRFSALCYDDFWFRKSAGCNGIKMLTCTPDLGVQWINDREVDLVRTLIHVLKDLPSDLPRDVDDVIDILTRVLRVSRGDGASSEANSAERSKVGYLVGILFAELSSANPVVRRAAQTGIHLIAELTGRPATEHMMPYRERMLTTIFNKPLRALPFNMQIGMLEAIRFCVCLSPPLLEVTEELLRLIHEALALADAEDSNLIGQRNDRQRNMDLIKLRVACITLLTASMPMMDFYAKHPTTRQRVTSVYFKSLYAPHQEVKEVAHEGLQLVLAHQNRLPKELLQTGLRPILMNLADPKRLSVSGLEGLARLLELLTNYFKVEIGHKLLDHFRFVADPQMLQASSKLPLADNDNIMKLVRLANIFHLLPSAANIFLEQLVNAVVQTEAHLHYSSRSPFSDPLAKYLDRYPVEAMDFFMKNLHLPRHVRTLRSILQAGLAPRLQRELASRTPTLVYVCLQGTDLNLRTPGLLLCVDLVEQNPTWINEHGYVIEALLQTWRNYARTGDVSTDVTERYALTMRIFVKALEQTPRIDLFFDLISVYSTNLSIDTVRLTHFLYGRIALNPNLPFRRNVLYRFIAWFEDTSRSWSDKGHFIRLIVTPTLSVHALSSPDHRGLLDEHIIDWMLNHIWTPMIDNSAFADAEDTFKVELLHMTTVMVQHYPDQLEPIRTAIIRCAWHYITNSDALVTQTAYLLAARFFEVYDSPEKFILRAWTGLLKPPHAEGTRSLVRQSLEVLAPVLPRCISTERGKPTWARATRRLLAEEGNGLSQLLVIYQLIVRHPDLFYPVRVLFAPHMVSSLPKLGFSPMSGHESRLLSLEVLQVLFDWERKASSSDVDMDSVDVTGNEERSNWTMPLSLRESMVSYLVRLATNQHEPPLRTVLLPRALSLLRLMLGHSGLKDVSVKLHFFSRYLDQADLTNEVSLQQAVGAAKVLDIVAAEKPQEWYQEHVAILQKLVRKGMMTDEAALHDSLHPIFDRLVRAYPLPKEDDDQGGEAAEFHAWIYATVGEGLGKTVALRGTLLMLKTVVSVTPERIEAFLVSLMRLGSKLAKDHISAAPTVPGYEHAVRVLISIFQICETGVAFLGEQRRWFINSLQMIVDKSKSSTMCVYVLDVARDWALSKRDPYPTMKDKAQILRTMVAYESRGDSLFNSYLELILDIYTEPSLRRSELTTRLEAAFILGCDAKDTRLRERFMSLLDSSVPRSLHNRLTYVLGVQSWESVASHHWIHIALALVLSAADGDYPLLQSVVSSRGVSAPSSRRVGSILEPMRCLLSADPQVAHEMWVAVFPIAWSCLSRREQVDITHHMIALLSREYHIKQTELRPNVIQTLLTGVHACTPPMLLPPHLVKYLAKTFGAWHIALEILGASLEHLRDEEISIRDTIYDALAEVYAEMAEEDLYYGLWRRRCLHPETNVAIAYEQHGMWEQACTSYETAQSRARSGAIAFSEPEYCLWEDHWVLANEKLQHWDLLYELGRNEANHELMLEAAWRIKDWGQNREVLEEQINLLPEVATPRRRVFEAFIALLKAPSAVEKNVEFTRILEDAMQLSLRKWVGLPFHLSAAHVPLLQHFQQFVELQEAVQIFGSLSGTTAQNLERKSQDLKMVLQAWRERLPNIEDDISIWSDLVAWRQRVFDSINKAYIPLISGGSQSGNGSSGSSDTFGYRGYHETAWIINRFAHVARKHDLLEVCFAYLNKIYTLPNIEISEAFLKLREQARCHYQRPNDLHAGLEVINNTNLLYFSPAQKAEFFTLKGMFQARFGNNDEANAAFGQAVQLDMNQAKAWAEWGKYNDRMFQENPTDLSHAASAVSCYLQAAGIFKNGKSRPLLARVLWLLSVDDNSLLISRQFDQYKGDGAWWYWITLIPQLCLSMSQREVSQARYVLLNLARLFPQALFYQLRTTREEMSIMKKRLAAVQAVDTARQADQDHSMQDVTTAQGAEAATGPDQARSGVDSLASTSANGTTGAHTSYTTRQPWDVVDEVVKILKTAFPLLILCLESMVEQITQRFRATQEEDAYRLVCMLMQDAISTLVHLANTPEDEGRLPVHTIRNLTQMAVHFQGSMRAEYEEEFLHSKPTTSEYVQRLQKWRDKYENYLDARPRVMSLDLLSHYLTEFQYGKYDEIEVPGQYLHECDNNQNFVRIQKFDPRFENCRTAGFCWKRLTIHGHDNSRTTFAVQLPSNRHCRREERVMQIFRTFNGHLERRKEARKRGLQFHLPIAVPCSPQLRLVQSDNSYITLGDIYDQYSKAHGFEREEPIVAICNKSKAILKDFNTLNGRRPTKAEYFTLKKDLLDEVQAKLVPDDILLKYMMRVMDGPQELWRMRKQFALELAASSFMTYIFCLMGRVPVRFHVSTATGRMFMSELAPSLNSNSPVFATSDTVPFRLTPNLQRFLGLVSIEGVFSASIIAIARCLTVPQYELDFSLCLFARDEVMAWLAARDASASKPATYDIAFRNSVQANIDMIVKRAETMACKLEREQATQASGTNSNVIPVCQTVVNLISTATNPINLVKMTEPYHPWF